MSIFDEETRPIRRKDPINWKAIVLWILGVLTTVSLAIGGFASQTLWGHDSRLTTIETRLPAVERKLDDHEARDSKAWDKLGETLRRMEDKLDSLRDRVK